MQTLQKIRQAVWAGWFPLARLAGRHYIAGTEVRDAVQTAERLAGQAFTNTLCYWNGEQDAPELVARQYAAILDALAGAKSGSYLSVKATALGYDRSLLENLIARAKLAGTRIHFDAMWPDSAEPTFELLADLRTRYDQLSCTLPGRWQRSLRDAARVSEWQMPVRVVKGQWADPAQPEINPHAGFLAVIDRLAGRAAHVAVATHEPALARAALERLRAAGTSCELELLFGLPTRAVVPIARALNVPVRVYVPYGAAWAPYCLSQVRRNPRMLWWVARDALLGRAGTLFDAALTAKRA